MLIHLLQAQTKYEYEDIASNKNITESIRTVTRKYVGAANSSNILGKFYHIGDALANSVDKDQAPRL